MMEDEVKRIQRAGTCRYCHQQRFVEVPEDANGMIRIRMTYKDTNEETF